MRHEISVEVCIGTRIVPYTISIEPTGIGTWAARSGRKVQKSLAHMSFLSDIKYVTEVCLKRIEKYLTENGRCPYDEWYASRRDKRTKAIIAVRLNRVVQGNYGLCRRLEDGVWELKIDYGPGYRVYFAEDGDVIVVLLCGGDKSTQARDIQRARKYWADYRKE